MMWKSDSWTFTNKRCLKTPHPYKLLMDTEQDNTASTASASASAAPPATPAEEPKKLVNVLIRNQNDALQVLVMFLNLAQKRGAFSIDESAKIWECMKMFQ